MLQTNRIYRMVPFAMTLNDPKPDFKGNETIQERHMVITAEHQ